jgi:hypothetical protein
MWHALNRRYYQGQAKILVLKLITRKESASNLKKRNGSLQFTHLFSKNFPSTANIKFT